MLTPLTALALLALTQPPSPPADLPVVLVDHDNFSITSSCRVTFPPGVALEDADNNGVLHIDADGITVEFEPGALLSGAAKDTPGDRLKGIGLLVDGRKNVTIRNASVSGFKTGIFALTADGLTIDGADLHDNFRQHLKSVASREDESDWLWPHRNDEHEWLTNYGAAVYVERSAGVTVRGVRVRAGQNGIVLDRVADAKVYDNDCSFLSGWGLAMWRSSRSTISRNAFDFCVRGHSEGVYNRGQDSAGILFFEQCSDNVFVENSATHGGDGFFGFAGKEAIGEAPPPRGAPPIDFAKAACRGNLLLGNDFSYAPAHGVELTFGRDNKIIGNRMEQDAICGVWGGYSQGTLIAGNHVEGCGGMSYGPERGGVNIEHGSRNRIVGNTFLNNRCAVHLWWDDDGALMQFPGVKALGADVADNVIAGNTIEVNEHHPFHTPRDSDPRFVALHIRDVQKTPPPAPPPAGAPLHVRGTVFSGNTVKLEVENAAVIDAPKGEEPSDTPADAVFETPAVEPLGKTHPVGARPDLRGRDKIFMDDWGPWDHETPMVRLATSNGLGDVYETFGDAPWALQVDSLDIEVTEAESLWPRSRRHIVGPANPDLPGVYPYKIEFITGDIHRSFSGSVVSAKWEVRFFPWTVDPRENYPGWIAESKSDKAVVAPAVGVNFQFGSGGPHELMGNFPGADQIGPDHFGTIAKASLVLPAGKWKFRTLSDDGVRVRVNDKTVVENWTWHGPTVDEGVFEQTERGTVDVTVEHFEIDGYAVLRLDILPG